MSDQEKTEDASERQHEKFREQGKLPTSRELLSAVAMCAGLGALSTAFPMFGSAFGSLAGTLRSFVPDGELSFPEVRYTVFLIGMLVGPPLALVLAAPAAVSVVSGLVLTGFNTSTDPLTPDLERLNPIPNFKSTFMSVTPWVTLAKSLLVGGAMVWAVWAGLREHLDSAPTLGQLPVEAQLAHAGAVVSSILQRALPAAVAIGALDYLYQRWKSGEDMKMSKQEVKDEHKDSDGDPQMKARRRARSRQIAGGNAVRNVAKADVVITNPTHYAVAIRYRKDENAAPMVVARGVDDVALRMRAEANRSDVPIIENRPLARALYAHSKAGLPIPREFYQPVAQVLAVVYRRRRGRPPTT